MILNLEQNQYITHFVEGINYEVSRLFSESSSSGEEDLTFYLGQLLDSTALHQKMLDYTLFHLNLDLYYSNQTSNIKLQTHFHSRYYEGKTSIADFGIIIEINNTIKCALIQCKKLKLNDTGFDLNSKYDIKTKQFDKIVDKEIDHDLKYYYLFYNPLINSFKRDYNKIINYESILALIPLISRPGIKIADISFLKKTRHNHHKNFSLEEAYTESKNYTNTNCGFIDFSSFILGLINCKMGKKVQTNHEMYEICSGKHEKYSTTRTLNIKIKAKTNEQYV